MGVSSVKEENSSSWGHLVTEHRENGRKLARSFLRRWRVRMDLEEVDSAVDLALCEAASRYDEKKGAAFMTFFYYHLRGHMVRAVERAANNSAMMVNFSHSTEVDIADWAQKEAHNFAHHASSSSEENPNPEAIALRRERIKHTRSVCHELDSLEQEVLSRAFEKEEALVDIAESLGYSRCHISRVKKRALGHLKHLITTQGMAPEMREVVQSSLNEQLEAKGTRRKRSRRGAEGTKRAISRKSRLNEKKSRRRKLKDTQSLQASA